MMDVEISGKELGAIKRWMGEEGVKGPWVY